MSRILVVTSSPPSAEGGHLVVARSLVKALGEAGHEAGMLVTPQNRFGRFASTYLAAWLTDVGVTHDGRPIDQVISLRYPSYAVRHDRHVCWLNHRLREYYDLWPRFYAGLSRGNRVKERIRRTFIHRADRYLLRHRVRRVYAQSKTVRARLERFGGIAAEVLYPPAPQRAYRCDDYGDFVLAISRLTPLKRLDLPIRALALPAARAARLVVVGEGAQGRDLHALAAELGVIDRVEFAGRLDDEGLLGCLAHCRAVCFPPYDEDYGFVTAEAFASAKAVVTCSDSGGPAELVRDGVNGMVCAPDPEAIAAAMGALTADRRLAERLGAAGRETASGLSWDRAVCTLLGA